MMCGVPLMAVSEMMRSYMKLIHFDFEIFKHLISVSMILKFLILNSFSVVLFENLMCMMFMVGDV
jgi:hypothetical protein